MLLHHRISFHPQSASDFARTSAEADVCKDLIDNYRDLFNVTKEELDREEAIMRKTENFNRNPNPVKVFRRDSRNLLLQLTYQNFSCRIWMCCEGILIYE